MESGLNTNTNVNIKENKLKFKEKFSYGLGDMASNFVFTAFTTWIVFFSTEGAGIKAATVGVIILISKIFDAISDAVMGVVVDRYTHSKYGKARPWLLRMAIPFAISAVIAFMVPFSGNTAKIIYMFITYNIVMTVYTMINIPYGVLAAKITQKPAERGDLNIFRMVGALVGMMIVSIAIPVLYPIIGGGDPKANVQPAGVLTKGFPVIFAVLGVIGAVLFVLTFLGTKERIDVKVDESITISDGFKSLLKNRNWIIMFFFQLSMWIVNAMKAASVSYFAIYYLKNRPIMPVLMMAGYLPGIITMIALGPILFRKIGKRNTALWCYSILFVTTVLSFILVKGPQDTSLLLILSVIGGLAMGPAMATSFAMIADCIEYGEWKTGIRVEGLTYSAASLGGKLGSGIGGLILGLVLTAYGHVPDAATQTAHALAGYKMIYLGLPIISGVLMILFMYLYDVDKHWPTIMKDLEARRGSAVIDQ